MKQRIIKLIIMMVFVLALTGCGGESQSDADDEKTAQQEDDGWKKAYAKTVQKESADDAEYALIYITDDAIPELLIHDKGEGVYRVYSYCDESSVLALDNMQEDKFCYLEKDNKIIQVLVSIIIIILAGCVYDYFFSSYQACFEFAIIIHLIVSYL